MNEETSKPKTDTDGVLDRCSRCGARARWIINGAECTECAECVIVPLSESRSEIMVAWNRKQRKAGVPIEHMATDTPVAVPVEQEKKGSGYYTRPNSVKTLMLAPGVIADEGSHVSEIAARLAANNPGRTFGNDKVTKILAVNKETFEKIGKGVYRMKQENKETK